MSDRMKQIQEACDVRGLACIVCGVRLYCSLGAGHIGLHEFKPSRWGDCRRQEWWDEENDA
jgi:hypothetical protein